MFGVAITRNITKDKTNK